MTSKELEERTRKPNSKPKLINRAIKPIEPKKVKIE